MTLHEYLQSVEMLVPPDVLRENKSVFEVRVSDLLIGQVNSVLQRGNGAALNWQEYYHNILNQKTLNFFMAPLPLFCFDRESTQRRHVLESCFLELNRGHLHWQLLDDIADLKGDLSKGIINGVGAVLISQGRIATYLKNLAINDVASIT